MAAPLERRAAIADHVGKQMMIRLKPLNQQTFVLAYATSGNGLATVEKAIRRGTSVLAVTRNEDALAGLGCVEAAKRLTESVRRKANQ